MKGNKSELERRQKEAITNNAPLVSIKKALNIAVDAFTTGALPCEVDYIKEETPEGS